MSQFTAARSKKHLARPADEKGKHIARDRAFPGRTPAALTQRRTEPASGSDDSAAGTAQAPSAIIEGMPEGAVTVTTQGFVVYCNPRFASMLGLSQARITGRLIQDLVDTADRPALESLLSGEIQRSHDINLRTVRRKKLPVTISASQLQQGDETVVCMVVTDFSEPKQAQQLLGERERKYREMFENAVEGICQISPDGRYLSVNTALAQIYGYPSPAQFMVEMNSQHLSPYEEPGRQEEFMELVLARGEVHDFESRIRRRDDTEAWISESARTVHDEHGNLLHLEAWVTDITARKQSEAQLNYQANYDALTGLANRHRLQERLQQSLTAAQRYGHQVIVAFIDLDMFKFINDSLGHDVGDKLLRTISTRLESCVRETDTVARNGGDEFVLIIDHADKSVISSVLPKILDSVSRPVTVDEHELQVTCSIGISLFPNDGRDAETLLKCADTAMYKAKELGRNNVQFFTPELTRKVSKRLAMEADLRGAMLRKEFFLLYQPKIDLQSGRISSVEALIRWKRHKSVVLPRNFLPLAEQTGMAVLISEWVLRQACQQIRSWQQSGMEAVPVSVNLSARQFSDRKLLQVIDAALDESGVDPRLLEIEVTESAVMNNVEAALLTLEKLKKRGVRVSIDDFGTGYSSLSSLRRLPIESLKIDRSFVSDITAASSEAPVADSIISLARILKFKVIAEGVETEVQYHYLRSRGCDQVQGNLFSKPVSAREIEEMILRGRAPEMSAHVPPGQVYYS